MFPILWWILASVVVAFVAVGTHAEILGRTIKIGVLTDLNSLFADASGESSVLATQMAIEDFSASSKGLGAQVISADHQNKADIGVATRLGADPRIRAKRVGVLGHNRRKGGSQSLVATDPAKLLVVRQIVIENANFDTVIPERFETIEQRIMFGRHKSARDQKIEADLHHVSPLLPTSGLAL